MYSIQIKNQAKSLRNRGKSIYDIAKILGLNPTTISYWCRDIKLSKSLIQKISDNGKKKTMVAMLVYTEKQRIERLSRQRKERMRGKRLLGKLSSRDLMIVCLGLYWGEGYKGSDGELGFTNSNPDIIKFYLSWLSLLCVPREDLIFRLTINDVFKNHAVQIKTFWITRLRVKEGQFSKTTLIKTGLKKADIFNEDTYKGILRVKVRSGNALKNRILGALEHISTCT